MEQKKHNGFFYSKGTKKGFLRMQRMGIPQPPFSIENNIARILKERYIALVARLVADFTEEALNNNLEFEQAELVTDAKKDTKKMIDEAQKKKGKSVGAHNRSINKAAVASTKETLKRHWFDEAEGLDKAVAEELRARMDKTFYSGQQDFMTKFFKDASEEMQQILVQFSLDKDQVFQSRLEDLRTLYIDNALERINGEENELKRIFLKKLTDYVEGRTATLDVADLAEEMNETAVHVARFFARDQMARFNKALTVSTFYAAGVKKVKWVTVGDQRVRDTHKVLNGRVFDINNLPPEKDDYNCRCGLVPYEYE